MKPPTTDARRRAARAAVVFALCARPHDGLAGASPRPAGADLFPEGPEGSRNLVVVGLFLADDPARLRIASTLLARGTLRLRREGRPDPAAEVVLGETLEEIARRGLPPPDGARFVGRFDVGRSRSVEKYDGAAFRLALDALRADPDSDRPRELRERASAGLLRARFPFPETSLVGLFLETSAWLALVEESRTDRVVSQGATRLARAAPSLGRLLLAAGRTRELAVLAGRLRKAARRVRLDFPKEAAGRRLVLAASVVRRIRGDGTAPFPQEAWAGEGPAVPAARIEGEIGRLALVLRTSTVGSEGIRTESRKLYEPLLPVPGSLRVSRDGRRATWLEVAGPASVAGIGVRVTSVSLGSGEPVVEASLAPRKR
jgi:hypothetical protein